MKKIKNLKFYTFDEALKKAQKRNGFKEVYEEELVRLRLAGQLKEFRLKKNLTQKELAKKATMPQSVIARLESGEHSFSLGTLARIAHAIGKEVQLV